VGPTAPLLALDAQNRRHAHQVGERRVEEIAKLDHDYNVYFEYGQSNREGAECWPALSTRNLPGNLMFGADIRPRTREGTFRASGEAGFRPLLAQVIDGKANPLDPQVVAELPEDAKNRGETPGIGAVNHLRLLTEAHEGEASRAHAIVLANGAVGGMAIEALERDHRIGEVEFYGRYRSLIEQTRALAAAEGKSCQVLGVGWIQGEADYIQPPSPSATRFAYKAALGRVHRAMVEDALACGGNSRPPGFFMWQVGGPFTRNTDATGAHDLFIGMATWEYARETAGAWLIGPTYPYTDKSLHLDSNGARWCGLKEGQVLDRVINQGLDWEPVAPLAVEQSGRIVDLHYHVPCPPLRFAPAWSAGRARSFPGKGFRVTDAAGNLPLEKVEIVAPTIVRLHLAREPQDEALCWYADKAGYHPAADAHHLGQGNLCDSDPADPFYVYEYLEGSGMYPSAEIAELVGRPYDMANWAIAHCLPLNWTRPDLVRR